MRILCEHKTTELKAPVFCASVEGPLDAIFSVQLNIIYMRQCANREEGVNQTLEATK